MNQSNQFLPIIESIATGTPKNIIPQANAAKFVANFYASESYQSRIEKIYKNTRIEHRHLAVNLLTDEATFCHQTSNLEQRMQLYEEFAVPLAEEVVKKALSRASEQGRKAGSWVNSEINSEKIEDKIGLLVFVTSTGFLAPGIDAKLIKNLGLRRDIARVPINFMGCAAAMNGLRVGCDYVRTHPHQKALVICLELSSVNAVFEENINDIIIHSIFGDGCAAVVLGACPAEEVSRCPNLVIRDHLSYLTEDTEDGIRLAVRNNGITCQLSPQLPSYIESGLAPIIHDFLASCHLGKADIDLWAVHPGGTRIIENVQRSLGLQDQQLRDSWEILREYGNMLSCAVLFVMERMLCRLKKNDHTYWHCKTKLNENKKSIQLLDKNDEKLTGIAFSFSPGVGIEGLLFEKFYQD